jgi:hypothetical protein
MYKTSHGNACSEALQIVFSVLDYLTTFRSLASTEEVLLSGYGVYISLEVEGISGSKGNKKQWTTT